MATIANRQFTSKNVYYTFLHIVVLALCVQVIILSRQIRQMKEGNQSAKQEQLRVDDMLAVNDLMPVQSGVVLDTLSERQLIFIFTTTCPFCLEVLPLWKHLNAGVSASLPVFAISLDSRDSTYAYVVRNNIPFPVFIPKDREVFKQNNRVHLAPMTLTRTRSGKVERLWVGRLNEEMIKEVGLASLPAKTNQTK
jgi:hypothetical protein